MNDGRLTLDRHRRAVFLFIAALALEEGTRNFEAKAYYSIEDCFIYDFEEARVISEMAPGVLRGRVQTAKSAKGRHSEGQRRLVHSSIGFLVTALYWAGISAHQVLRVLIWVLAGWTVFDAGRLLFPAWRPLFLRLTGNILRPHEHEQLTSSFWFLLGTCLTLWLYAGRERVVVFSLLALCWSDPMASLVGRRWGGSVGRRLPNGKSLEGWLAAWAVGTLIAAWFSSPFEALKCGLIAATVEACTLRPLDDNLVVPLVTGFLLTWFTKL